MRWSNRIHVDDLSASIVAAISFQGLLPQMMNLADDNPTQAREIVEYYCRTFSFPSPPSISSFEAERRGLETMLSNQKISNALLRKVLQRQLAYPSFRDGALTEFS